MRWLVLAAVGVLLGCLAIRRSAARPPAAVPARARAVPPAHVQMPPATPRLAVIDEPFVHDNGVEEAADDEVVDDTDEPIFSAEVASHLTQLAAAQAALRTNGLLHGRVYNAMTGEPLAGATIVVTRGRDESQAVISDGGGWYQLELPGGTYTVAVYYVDHTTEYGDVYVPSGRSALLFPRLLLLAGDDTFGVSFSSGSTSENVYVID